jgi:hypothetical protein
MAVHSEFFRNGKPQAPGRAGYDNVHGMQFKGSKPDNLQNNSL